MWADGYERASKGGAGSLWVWTWADWWVMHAYGCVGGCLQVPSAYMDAVIKRKREEDQAWENR